MFELAGSMTILPTCSDCFRPTFVHVRPPSTDLYTPSPYDTERCALFSPVPTHTTLRFVETITTFALEYDPSPSNTGVPVVPAFLRLRTPHQAGRALGILLACCSR